MNLKKILIEDLILLLDKRIQQLVFREAMIEHGIELKKAMMRLWIFESNLSEARFKARGLFNAFNKEFKKGEI